MSSVPTPDMSVDFYHQTNAGNEIQPHNVPHTRVIAPTAPTHPSVYSAQEDPFKSPVNYKVFKFNLLSVQPTNLEGQKSIPMCGS